VWAALEGNSNTFHSYTKQKRRTEILALKMPVSAGMPFNVCKWKLGWLGLFSVVCEMCAAQLLTALCSPNAQQTGSRLCGNFYKINGT